MVTIFENFFSVRERVKEFASLFYRKICEYGNVEGRNYLNRDRYEIELIENDETAWMIIVEIRAEIDDIVLLLKSSLQNESVFYNSLMDYFNESDFFKKKIELPSQYGKLNTAIENINRYEILGTPEEIEEDIKNLETRIQAKKYNL